LKYAIICVIAGAITVWFAGLSLAHKAPSGWQYSIECCHNKDCRQISREDVIESERGYNIRFTGETLTYSDERLRKSMDGLYHWCECVGCGSSKKTRCLYIPPKGM